MPRHIPQDLERRKLSDEELKEILDAHQRWLEDLEKLEHDPQWLRGFNETIQRFPQEPKTVGDLLDSLWGRRPLGPFAETENGRQADFSRCDLRGQGHLLEGRRLSFAMLAFADLRGVNFFTAAAPLEARLGERLEAWFPDRTPTDLSGAYLPWADLSETDLTCANLEDALLLGAKLRGATLIGANLSRATLSDADLSGAILADANLSGADCNGTDFRDANLRGVRGLRLDNSLIRNAHFSPVEPRFWAWVRGRGSLNDPWSVLRQLYAGPRLLFLILFLVTFLLPYLGRIAYWAAIGHGQDEARRIAGMALEQVREEIGRLELSGDARHQVPARIDWGKPRPVWQKVLRWDRGFGSALLVALLLTYGGGTYMLATSVGPLRDEEERTGYSPAWDDYRRLIWVHYGVSVLFYLSVGVFLWNMWALLTTEVYEFHNFQVMWE